MDEKMRIAVAEAVGTAVLIIGGVGTAVLSGGQAGQLGIAVAFGLSLFAMVYTVGHVSGCHVNPAVTLAAWAARRIDGAKVPYYVVGQLVGGVVGALVVLMVASGKSGLQRLQGRLRLQRLRRPLPRRLQPRRGRRGRDRLHRHLRADHPRRHPQGRDHNHRRRGHRPGPHLGAPDQHPGEQHLGEPGPQLRHRPGAARLGAQQLWAFIVFPMIGGVLGALIWLAVDPDEFKTWEGAAEPAPSGG